MIRPRRAWPLYEKLLRNARRARARRRSTGAPPLRHRAPPRRRARDRRRPLRRARPRRPRRADGAARRRARRAPEAPATRCSHRRARSAIYEGGLVPVDAGDVLYRIRAGAHRRRDGRDRAAARLPGQRPRRRDAARRRSPARRRVGAQARGRAPSIVDRGAAARHERSSTRAGVEIAAVVRAGRRRSSRRTGARGRLTAVDARRASGSTATCSSSPAAASPRTRCSRRRARASSTTPRRGHLRPDRASRRRRGRRLGGRRASARRPAPARLDGRRRQVLRLHLRGRDRRRT